MQTSIKVRHQLDCQDFRCIQLASCQSKANRCIVSEITLVRNIIVYYFINPMEFHQAHTIFSGLWQEGCRPMGFSFKSIHDQQWSNGREALTTQSPLAVAEQSHDRLTVRPRHALLPVHSKGREAGGQHFIFAWQEVRSHYDHFPRTWGQEERESYCSELVHHTIE